MTNASLALCAIVLMSGCSGRTPKMVGGTCSPIVISDTYTHLEHRGSHDFHIAMNGSSLQATIGNGTAYTSLLFCGSGLSNCTGSTAIALTAPWTLWIWDTVNYPGQPVLTLSPNGDRTVAAIFGSGLAIDVDEDYTTTSGDDANGGTKLTQSNYTFNTAVLMNPVTGAPPNPQSNCNGLSNCTVYTCAASSGCALEIKHQ